MWVYVSHKTPNTLEQLVIMLYNNPQIYVIDVCGICYLEFLGLTAIALMVHCSICGRHKCVLMLLLEAVVLYL